MERFTDTKQPSNLDECFKSQGDSIFNIPKLLFCNATWDTVLCWPPTLKGSEIKLPCPGYLGLSGEKYAVKACGVDGNWEGRHPGIKEYPDWEPGWTNYSQCKGVVYEVFINTSGSDINASESAPISLGALPMTFSGADILACVVLSLSVIFTMASLGISCFAKGIQATRSRIFRNLFAAYLFHDILELVINISRTMESGDVINDVETCVAFGVLITLTSSAIFAWIIIVGVYYTMSMKSIVIERRMYYVLCLLGWFVPTVVTITWLSVTVLGGNLHCWYAELFIAKLQTSFWIVEASNIFFLATTWTLLVYFLVRYNEHETHRRNNENKELLVELGHIKQSAYKVFVVLSFVTFAYVIYMAFAHYSHSEVLGYLYVLTVYSRGIVTPAFLCFLDDTCNCWDGIYAVNNTELEEEESENSA